MLWLLQGGWWVCGWCYYHRADVIAMGQCSILILVLRCFPEPHPICVADGICQHFCSGMDYWPLCIESPLLLIWGYVPPFPLCWRYQHLYHDQWWYDGQIWGGGLLMFSKPFTKGSWGLSYIFLITVHPPTFVTVDDPTFLHHRIFILWGHQEVFDGGTSSKVYLYTIVAALFLDRFTQPPVIRYSYVWFGGVLLLSVFVILFLLLLGWIVYPHFYPVHSPSGVIAVSKCSSEVVIFLLQLFMVRAYGFCSMI